MTDFRKLLEALTDAGVEFIIVGGAAATFHGSSRLTQDLDVVYSRRPENIARLVSALSALRPYPRGAPDGLPFQWDHGTVARGLNFTLRTLHGDLDLLGEIPGGGGYEALLASSTSVRVFDVDCAVLDLPKLIDVKRAAGRPRDFEAVAELEAIFEERQRED